MSYHDLSSCTLDDDQRREEADRILKMLEGEADNLTTKEQDFMEQMQDGGPVSVKQLFWMRDIKDKYL